MRRFLGALLFVAVAFVAAGCADNTPATPSVITPVQTTDALDGSLTTGGALFHVITARVGQVVMTMEGISDPSMKLGMQIGVYSTLSCTGVMENPSATIGSTLVGVTTSQTQLCVKIFDANNLIPADTSIAYHVTVQHY